MVQIDVPHCLRHFGGGLACILGSRYLGVGSIGAQAISVGIYRTWKLSPAAQTRL